MSGSILSNIPFNSEPVDDKMNGRIRKTANRLYSDISNKNQHKIQKAFHRVIFSFGIKPFVMSQGTAYQGVINKWKNSGVV